MSHHFFCQTCGFSHTALGWTVGWSIEPNINEYSLLRSVSSCDLASVYEFNSLIVKKAACIMHVLWAPGGDRNTVL